MIDETGRIVCDACVQHSAFAVMGRVEGRMIILFGRHHGEKHIQTMNIFDLLPPPDSLAYSDLVADLVKRIDIAP